MEKKNGGWNNRVKSVEEKRTTTCRRDVRTRRDGRSGGR